MWELLISYKFMQYAVIASVLCSIGCGIVGTIIVEKKLVMLSGGIAHTAYGGVGLGYLLGFEPIIGGLIFAVCSGLGICFVNRKGGTSKNTVIALFWSFCMALGILFISFMEGYPPDMNSYLFGNILAVSKLDLIAASVITALILIVIFTFYNDWKAYLFDAEFAKVIGIKTTVFEYGLMVIIALIVVVFIRVVGIIMCIALLAAPAATAVNCSKKLGIRMLYSIGFSLISCFLGLFASYELNISSGATIIIVAITIYALSFFIKKIVSSVIKNKKAKA